MLPDNENRPAAANSEAAKDTAGELGSNPMIPGARRRWAYAMIARCASPPPRYGTAEWFALPETDYRRIAAVVLAAESWAVDGDDIEDRLRAEIEAEAAAFKAAEDAAYRARAAAHRAEWDADAGAFRPDPRIAAEIEAEWRTWATEGRWPE